MYVDIQPSTHTHAAGTRIHMHIYSRTFAYRTAGVCIIMYTYSNALTYWTDGVNNGASANSCSHMQDVPAYAYACIHSVSYKHMHGVWWMHAHKTHAYV